MIRIIRFFIFSDADVGNAYFARQHITVTGCTGNQIVSFLNCTLSPELPSIIMLMQELAMHTVLIEAHPTLHQNLAGYAVQEGVPV